MRWSRALPWLVTLDTPRAEPRMVFVSYCTSYIRSEGVPIVVVYEPSLIRSLARSLMHQGRILLILPTLPTVRHLNANNACQSSTFERTKTPSNPVTHFHLPSPAHLSQSSDSPSHSSKHSHCSTYPSTHSTPPATPPSQPCYSPTRPPSLPAPPPTPDSAPALRCSAQ